jgi:hypothetical protein
MKNLIYFLFLFVAACAPRTTNLSYEIFSHGTDFTMVPSQGHITLLITRQGEYSTGTIEIKCDSLTTIDSVITSNVTHCGNEFIDISLRTSGYRIIMYDKMFGIFTHKQEEAVVFYDTKKKKW